MHARDTINIMVEQKVCTTTDFNWVSQLRYEWSPAWKPGQAVKTGDDTLVIRIVNAKVSNHLKSTNLLSVIVPEHSNTRRQSP